MTNDLQKLRREIDQIDKKLLKFLAERFKIVQKIGEYKAKYNLPVTDKKREAEILKTRRLLAKKFKVDPNLISQIFKIIFKFAGKNQKR
ncbi:MAG: chorismate mutase [Patescibacteria group bacterium]|nr:chorismate mutase [Patescibacteria group bacterium]